MQRIILLVGTATVVLVATLVAGEFTADNKYIGVKACAICHKTEKQGKQFDIWQKSKHASAYKTLTTEKANEIAKARGLTKPAAESAECLQCHAITETKLVDKGFEMSDGVQCESCHGAGSAYKTMSIMKDKAKAIAAGLTEYKDDADIEKMCRTCHNEKSPTYKEFKFGEMWKKIEHRVPKK